MCDDEVRQQGGASLRHRGPITHRLRRLRPSGGVSSSHGEKTPGLPPKGTPHSSKLGRVVGLPPALTGRPAERNAAPCLEGTFRDGARGPLRMVAMLSDGDEGYEVTDDALRNAG